MSATRKNFTKAQKRAFDWLPADGSWREMPGKLSPALDSLWLCHRDLLTYEFGRKYGSSGGEGRRWRLTEVGISFKTAESEDVPEVATSPGAQP